MGVGSGTFPYISLFVHSVRVVCGLFSPFLALVACIWA